METAVEFIKTSLIPDIKTIHYFSDGSAGQYKNWKHFYNLCFHASDFSIDCKWNFFATSHGKLPCDGIGTMKRVTARASLQKTTSGHILTAEQMFKFCKEAIPSVNFVYITANEINTGHSKLDHQYSITETIPGTQSYHPYIPTSNSTIKLKRASCDDRFECEFDFLKNRMYISINIQDICIAQYILCKYDDHYWIGMVFEVDLESKEVKVKFMHPSYPSNSYKWPTRGYH